MHRICISAGGVLAGSLLAAAASATTVVTDSSTLGTTNLAAGSRQASAGGVTATFSAQTADSFMQVDTDGIYLQGAGDLLNVTFDHNVTVSGYSIGFANEGTTGNIEFYVDDGT